MDTQDIKDFANSKQFDAYLQSLNIAGLQRVLKSMQAICPTINFTRGYTMDNNNANGQGSITSDPKDFDKGFIDNSALLPKMPTTDADKTIDLLVGDTVDTDTDKAVKATTDTDKATGKKRLIDYIDNKAKKATDKAKKAKAINKAKAIQGNNKIDLHKDLFDWLKGALNIPVSDTAMLDHAKNGTSIKAFIVGMGAQKKLIKTPNFENKGGLFCGGVLTDHIPDIYKKDKTVCQKPLFDLHSKGNYKMYFKAGAVMTKTDLVKIRKVLLSVIDPKSLPKNFTMDVVNK
ncbi:MAG: hypothetical protein KAQ85_00055 [Thermodesulfovibrionia bacterium]|nr:hypothetical protein [Thermodesulfovibrionia bacterium]